MKYILLLLLLLPGALLSQEETEYKTVSIYFRGGSYYIMDEDKERVRDFLSKEILTNYEIHIHSHTDNIGGVEFNKWLSKMRSESAYQFLETDGVPTTKIFIKDHGFDNPKFDNTTWDGRLKNRRVDIVLWPLPF